MSAKQLALTVSLLALAAGAAGFVQATPTSPGCPGLKQLAAIVDASNAPNAVKQIDKPYRDPATGINWGGVQRRICTDLTGDKRPEEIAVLSGGGSVGDTAWLIVGRGNSGGKSWKLLFARNELAGALKVLKSHQIETSWGIYAKTDPLCCPSGPIVHHRYGYKSGTFRLLKVWQTPPASGWANSPSIRPLADRRSPAASAA